MIWAYLAGLLTLPAFALISAALYAGFWPDGSVRMWCDFDAWQTDSKRKFVRWALWRVHLLSREHRAGALLGPAWKRVPQPDWVAKQRVRDYIDTDDLLGPTTSGRGTDA